MYSTLHEVLKNSFVGLQPFIKALFSWETPYSIAVQLILVHYYNSTEVQYFSFQEGGMAGAEQRSRATPPTPRPTATRGRRPTPGGARQGATAPTMELALGTVEDTVRLRVASLTTQITQVLARTGLVVRAKVKQHEEVSREITEEQILTEDSRGDVLIF